MELRSSGEDAYFVASNSVKGFHSYYNACFDHPRIDRLYAVKGGPGTGKSFFLRAIATQAEEEGWAVEYIYCASDPSSLDGVILTSQERCIALLDATAPHVYEMGRPGIREELIDLGAFWSTERLIGHAEELGRLDRVKCAGWARTYQYLEAYGLMSKIAEELVSPFIRKRELVLFAERLIGDVKGGEGFEMHPALFRSFGMRGDVAYDTYLRSAEHAIVLRDCRGCSAVLMQRLLELAEERRVRVRLSRDPLLPSQINGIFFEKEKLSIVVMPTVPSMPSVRAVDLRRFVNISALKPLRDTLTYTERMRRAMLEGARMALEEVKNAHFSIERIYSSCMDFDAKEKFTAAFGARLFDAQPKKEGRQTP